MSKYFRIKGIEEDEIFRNLFIDYYPSLISFALYYVGDKTIAEDLVQEVFVKLWETRERWSVVGDFSAYVYQMVRFKCFNYLRAEKIRNEATRSFTEEINITEINNYIAEETFRLVMNSMEDLPPACRTVFSLTLEGYSAKEIAEKLDIVKSEIPWEKNLISFKSISPDGELFDMEEFKKAFLNRISIEGHKILNYGYAILRAIIARALVSSGLLPTLGIHHHNRYNAYCLADDIMEPYRPYVDKLVFQLVKDYGENVELTKEIKSVLLTIPTLDVVIGKKRSPLMVAATQTTASLYKCFSGELRKIAYPEM